jgi:antirestriction protein
MEESERQEKLAALKRLVELAEKAYDDMYEAHSQRDANDCYRDAKDYYHDAIGLARELGLNEEADKLHDRLWHIKQVFFGQFAN